jgi:hypothetical protein
MQRTQEVDKRVIKQTHKIRREKIVKTEPEVSNLENKNTAI